MKEQLFKQVFIEGKEENLPKEGKRKMYFVGVKDNLEPEDVYEWFNYKNPIMADNQAEYWLNTFDWYLLPVPTQPLSELTDEMIEKEAYNYCASPDGDGGAEMDQKAYSYFYDGAKWARDKSLPMTDEELRGELRSAMADYRYSEGCSCCRDIDAHKINTERIAKLLDVPQYSDGSGYDFSQFRTTSK